MEILRPNYTTEKVLFFEMTKTWKSAGGGRNRPEDFWIVLGHHNRNIWHLSITKPCFFHRFWKNIASQKRGWLFLVLETLIFHVFSRYMYLLTLKCPVTKRNIMSLLIEHISISQNNSPDGSRNPAIEWGSKLTTKVITNFWMDS